MSKRIFRQCSLAVGFFGVSIHVLAADVSAYIVNGTNASIGDYPNFASLFYDNDLVYGYRCGATVINSQYILTAAHCIYDSQNEMLNHYIAPGLEDESDYLNGNVSKARVEEYYYPNNYSHSEQDSWANDIAILKLETALNISDFSHLINTVENDSYALNNGASSFITIGHGYTQNDPDKNPAVENSSALLQTALTLKSSSVCDSTNKQLCFDGPMGAEYKNSTCNGDSGGPVYWYNGSHYMQIGITSYGLATCGDSTGQYTSVFTEVYDYQSWISSVISGQEIPKYKVVTTNGVRSLVRTSDSSVIATDGATTDSSGDSGGSIGMFTLLVMPFLLGTRRNPVRRRVAHSLATIKRMI